MKPCQETQVNKLRCVHLDLETLLRKLCYRNLAVETLLWKQVGGGWLPECTREAPRRHQGCIHTQDASRWLPRRVQELLGRHQDIMEAECANAIWTYPANRARLTVSRRVTFTILGLSTLH